MRSTGNSGPREGSLSIRLSPDGLSFWTPQGTERFIRFDNGLDTSPRIVQAVVECLRISGSGGFGIEYARFGYMGPECVSHELKRVNLHLDTLKTVLVPDMIFERDRIGDYLSINNIDIPAHEAVVVAHLPDGVVASMIYDRVALDTMYGVFGDRLRITSAFELADGSHGMTMYITEDHAYITVRGEDGGLRHCDVLPYTASADLFYYASRLAAQLDLARETLMVRGVGAPDVARLLRRIFRDSIYT